MADPKDTAAQREIDAEEGARVGWAAAQRQLAWEALHAPRGAGWLVNPYVWVVRFERSGGEE